VLRTGRAGVDEEAVLPSPNGDGRERRRRAPHEGLEQVEGLVGAVGGNWAPAEQPANRIDGPEEIARGPGST